MSSKANTHKGCSNLLKILCRSILPEGVCIRTMCMPAAPRDHKGSVGAARTEITDGLSCHVDVKIYT